MIMHNGKPWRPDTHSIIDTVGKPASRMASWRGIGPCRPTPSRWRFPKTRLACWPAPIRSRLALPNPQWPRVGFCLYFRPPRSAPTAILATARNLTKSFGSRPLFEVISFTPNPPCRTSPARHAVRPRLPIPPEKPPFSQRATAQNSYARFTCRV